MKPMIYLSVFLVSCAHHDCSGWNSMADHLAKNGVIALNVDPDKAWKWLQDEAAKDGCKIERR